MNAANKLLIAACGFFLAASALAQSGAELPPDALAKSVTEDIMGALRADKDVDAGNTQKAIQLVDAKVAPYFDFAQLTQQAMGRHWRDATPEQRQRIAAEFRTVLVRTYSNPLVTYRNRSVEFKAARVAPGETRTTVHASITRPDGPPIAIDLRMEKQPAGWKVYDVAIENVSLLENWRGQFNAQIQKNGIDGLIKSLADLNSRSRPATG